MKQSGFILCYALLFLNLTLLLAYRFLEESIALHRMIDDAHTYQRAYDFAERVVRHRALALQEEFYYHREITGRVQYDCVIYTTQHIHVYRQETLWVSIVSIEAEYSSATCKSRVLPGLQGWYLV